MQMTTRSRFSLIAVALVVGSGCTVIVPPSRQAPVPTVDITITPAVVPGRIPDRVPTATATLAPVATGFDPCVQSEPTAPARMSVAFVAGWDGDMEIYTADASGGTVTQLTRNTTDEVAPAWSPDGERIAFVSGSLGEPGQLQTMDATGYEDTVLVPNPIVIPPIVWSIDGRYLGFRGVRNGASDYYVVDLSDGSQTRLGVGEGYFDLGILSWSPSSDALALDVGLDSSGAMRGVLLVSLHQPQVHRLLPQPAGAYIDFEPQWHPTEDLIVVISAPISDYRLQQLYVVRADGSDRQQLTDTDTRKMLAAWSPNGRLIAYGAITYAIDSGGEYIVLNQQINVLARDGGNERVVIKGIEVGSTWFSWSPDSRHLAFIASEADRADRYNLYVTDVCVPGANLIAENVASFTPAWKPRPAESPDASDE